MPRTREREIVERCALVDARGRLRPRAVGWSRTPLHECSLHGAVGRKKRWHYWAVQDERFFLALTLADVDYLGLATASFLRLGERKLVERVVATPLAAGVSLPREVEGGAARFEGLGLAIAMVDEANGTRLSARFATLGGDRLDAEVFVRRPAGHESVNVVIPWSERRFQYTSKQVALPAEGSVRVNGETYVFGERAFGTLDFGRGVWPYRTTWNWGAASGVVGGRTIGMNLGGVWTRGTGMTENGVVVDGRVHKLGEELTFERDLARLERPWRVRGAEGGRVELTFVPEYTRHVRVEGGAVGSELHHAIGAYPGEVELDGGERVRVEGLRGWAEEHRARW